MKLKNWRAEQGLTQQELAEKLGVTNVAVSRYEAGRVPQPETIKAIQRLTAGAVTANDFFDAHEAPHTGQSDDLPPAA